jgi:opacity protein-like surface antigen
MRLAILLLATLAVAPASAQAPHAASPRPSKRGGGLWLDAGFGYGYLSLTCANCSSEVAASGTAVTVSAGFTPARNVLLGVQAQQWWSTRAELGQKESSLLVVVQWYPWPATGFFLRAGNGIVRGPGSQAANAPFASTQGTGVGFALGLGYDVKMNRRLGVTVQAATNISALGDLSLGGLPANDVIAYVTRLGVAIVLR